MRICLIVVGGLLAVGAAGVMGCRSVAPPTPIADLSRQQAHGRVVYEARCGVCHYDRENKPLHGPALVGMFKKPALASGAAANDERVMATIVHGHNLMPAMGNTMDQQDIDDLLAYLHTL